MAARPARVHTPGLGGFGGRGGPFDRLRASGMGARFLLSQERRGGGVRPQPTLRVGLVGWRKAGALRQAQGERIKRQTQGE